MTNRRRIVHDFGGTGVDGYFKERGVSILPANENNVVVRRGRGYLIHCSLFRK
jgi:hypothetical protein